jgi:hypothetical protein
MMIESATRRQLLVCTALDDFTAMDGLALAHRYAHVCHSSATTVIQRTALIASMNASEVGFFGPLSGESHWEIRKNPTCCPLTDQTTNILLIISKQFCATLWKNPYDIA